MGDFKNLWTSKLSYYPSSNNIEFETEYWDFSMIQNIEKMEIDISGLTEEGKETHVYQMEFKNKELMLHVYNCLDSTLNSRLEIKNIKQLLKKNNCSGD